MTHLPVIPLADVWTVAGAALASLSLGLRGNLLKPQARTWFNAPCLVFLAIMAVSIAMMGVAASVLGGLHATPREAVVACILGAASFILLANLWVQRRRKARGDG